MRHHTALRHGVGAQLLRYILCGLCGVAIDLVLYFHLLAAGVEYQAANLSGYAAGTGLSFFLNRHFTFRVRDNTTRRLAMFFAVATTGYLASAVMLWILVERAGQSEEFSKILTLGLVLAIQFTANRYITFRETPAS